MAGKTQQTQTPDFGSLKQQCDDCCNQLRQCGPKGQNALKDCEDLRNQIDSAHQMHSTGAAATVGAGGPDWAAWVAKLFTIIQTVLPLLIQGQQPAAAAPQQKP